MMGDRELQAEGCGTGATAQAPSSAIAALLPRLAIGPAGLTRRRQRIRTRRTLV
jgi:hypothetical protein